MSVNTFGDRLLTCEDDEFVLKVDIDIREYINNSKKRSVLLFPAVNSYRRFLIHKVCESITASQSQALSTFSIGAGDKRRTVVCHRYQLLVDLKAVSLKRADEAEFTWHYLNRNSVPKLAKQKKNQYCLREANIVMGVENAHQVADDKSTSFQQTIDDIETDQSAFDGNSSSDDPAKSSTKRVSSSRTRRPDRAIFIPRAKRSQTTPPSSTLSSNITSSKSRSKKSDKSKSKSIDENQSTSNSEDACEPPEISSAISTKCPLTCTTLSNTETTSSFASKNLNANLKVSSNEKNKKNLNNLSTMSEQAKVLIIESAGGINGVEADKDDKDEKELIKASQEINRSNRKLIKQTFNSNVLEIETACGSTVGKTGVDKAVNKEDDDWDTLFDDNGDCLDPKAMEELTAAVGKVNIETPKSNYKAYQANVDLLSAEEYPHVLECSNFPVEFNTQDLMLLFTQYKESGFDIKWVDDTHCLVIFSSARIAAEVLTMSHSFVRLKPLKEATVESRTKAKKCSHSLQPYKQRPETCAALAKRLVSGALGVRVKATSEERENERRILREAKERKLLASKQREEMWNN